MKTLYFDCFSGISGDMTIGALLDLGLDLDYLRSELAKLPVEGYRVDAARVVRSNLSAMKFDVFVERNPAPEGHGHPHGEARGGRSGSHHHKASGILEMIRSSRLDGNVKKIAAAIFTKLAISEGQVHHVAPEDVEFHEVGAVDSIVDTVGAAIGFEALGIGRYVCSPINVGAGFIHCQHGILPVPSPATADLLRGAVIYSRHAATELVTPTGAAILAAVVNDFRSFDGFVIEKIGYGAGSRQFQDFPNCLRLLTGEETRSPAFPPPPPGDGIVVIEANIDDMSSQNFAYVTDRLLEAGALDVGLMPMHMKKGRSGYQLQVLAPPNRADVLKRLIFEETTTIGLRYHAVERSVLERETVRVETVAGPVTVKVSKLDGKVVNISPEYDECAKIARESEIPLKEVQALAVRAYAKDLKPQAGK